MAKQQEPHLSRQAFIEKMLGLDVFEQIKLEQLDNDIVSLADNVIINKHIHKQDIDRVLQNKKGESILFMKDPQDQVLRFDADGNPIWNLGI